MKKLIYFIIIIVLIGGMIGANPSFSLADSWMSYDSMDLLKGTVWISHDSMDLEPLKGTVWMFSYTVGSGNHVDTITFSNDVVTTSSGTTVLLCKNQDNRDGGTVYADMSGFGRGFVAKIYSYFLDDNYNFIISGDTASGIYFRNNSTGSYISQYELHGVRISGPPIAQSGTIPIPVSQNAYNYPSAVNPVMQSNPANCQPFAIGDLSTGNLSLQVGLPAFSSGVDIYLAIGFADALFLIDGSNILHPASELTVLPKWKTNNTAAITESLYGNITTSLLPAGVYNLYSVVVPAGETDFSHYYFWATSFACSIDPRNVDNDGDGFTENQGDCRDDDDSINPGAIEICGDGIDQTCNNFDAPCDGGIVNQQCDDGECWLDISGEAQGQDRILESLNLGKNCICEDFGYSYVWWCEYQGGTGYIEGTAPGNCPSYNHPLYSKE